MPGPRGPTIKPHIKAIILNAATREHRGMPVPQLAGLLQRQIDEMGEIPPSESTLSRLISQYRNHNDPQDADWNLGALDDYPLAAEALPLVINVWMHCQEKRQMPLSVREAKWVGRLYKSVQAGNIGLLAKFAETLSSIEICHKVIPSPDTRDWRQLQLWWYEVITRGQETVTEDRKQKALATMSQPGYWTTTFVDVFREMVQQEKAKDPQSARQGQLDGTIPLPPRGRQVPKGRRA